jgi:hypothetical protein
MDMASKNQLFLKKIRRGAYEKLKKICGAI